jgi:hypothetical protein
VTRRGIAYTVGTIQVGEGGLKLEITKYPVSEAAKVHQLFEAHNLLENRTRSVEEKLPTKHFNPRNNRRIVSDVRSATASPWELAVLVRIRACRAVRIEEREAHRFARGLLDRTRALKVVKVRRGKAWARSVNLNASRLEVCGESDRDRVERRLRPRVDPDQDRRWLVRSELSVREPRVLETLTMRAAGA